MTAATDSIGEIVVVSLQASIQVLLLALVGAVACRMGLMSYETQKGLNGLIVTIITPCMLFTRVAEVVTPERFLHWWPLLLTALVYVFVGIGVGSVASRILRIRADMRPLFMSALGFKNTGSLPLSMAASLCAGSPILLAGPTDTPAAATTRAAAYCLFFTALTSILRWSVAYRMLSPPEPSTPTALSSSGSRSSEAFIMVDAFHTDDVEYGDGDALLSPDVKRQTTPSTTTSSSSSAWWTRSRLCALPAAAMVSLKRLGSGAFGRAVASIWRAIAQVMNPPLVAAIAAVTVGLITPIKGLLFGDDALFYPTVTRTLEFLGDCTIPMVMLNLGAKLIYYRTETSSRDASASSSTLGIKGNAAAILVNQFLFPLFGIAWVLMLAAIGGLVRTDPVLTFVLLLQACAPAAVNLLTLADMHATHEVAAANLLFYSYVVAIVSMTVWAVAYLEILENFDNIFGA